MDQKEIIIYKTSDGKANVALYARDGNIWLNQNQLAELFSTSKQNISQHISNVLEEMELSKDSVVKNFFTTAELRAKYEAHLTTNKMKRSYFSSKQQFITV